MVHRILRSQMGEAMPIGLPVMAMDAAMLRTAIPGASGGPGAARDQGDPDDDNVTVANSPSEAAYAKLFTFLADRLDPDDVQQVGEMVRDLLGNTDNGKGAALAADGRLRTPGYSQRFPHANLLYTRTYG